MIYIYLFFEFLKIGLISFGGGYSMIPLVKETVIYRGWMGEEEFYDFLGLCESTPGPIAINMATYVGTSTAGILGGIIATIGVILPAFIIILIIASVITKFLNNKHVKFFIKGIQPAVIGLIVSAGLVLLYQTAIKSLYVAVSMKELSLFLFVFLISLTFKIKNQKPIGTIPLICISAILGVLISL